MNHSFKLFFIAGIKIPYAFDELFVIAALEGGYSLVLPEGQQVLLLAYPVELPEIYQQSGLGDLDSTKYLAFIALT